MNSFRDIALCAGGVAIIIGAIAAALIGDRDRSRTPGGCRDCGALLSSDERVVCDQCWWDRQ